MKAVDIKKERDAGEQQGPAGGLMPNIAMSWCQCKAETRMTRVSSSSAYSSIGQVIKELEGRKTGICDRMECRKAHTGNGKNSR